MDAPIVTRRDDALTFTTSPTDVMRFLAPATSTRPTSTSSGWLPATARPCTATRGSPGRSWSRAASAPSSATTPTSSAPGDLLFTPPDVPHTFMAIGDTDAQIVGINWPGGFHRLYAEMAPLFQTGGPPDFGALAAAAARHGAEILGPPLAQLEAAGG